MTSYMVRFDREIALYLVLFLAAPFTHAASPSLSQVSAQETVPQTSAGQLPAPVQSATPEVQQPARSQTPTEAPSVPVGTAAAPVIRSGGNPASKPAGAAIAPAKQRRTRSYALRIGLIIGAAVAVGVVIAASLSSSSRPH